MMHKKGQGAMEYLMTYGWAILVVVIVGVVLYNMGIFSPSGATAPGMDGFGNVRPNEYLCDAATGDISAVVVNAAGQQITNLTMEGTACTNQTVAAGDTTTCTAADVSGCNGVSAGDRYESTITFGYDTAGGLTRESTGTIWGPAE
jgi:hypothetical protein